VPFKVRLDDKRQVIWEGFYVEDSIPITMSLHHKGYISSKKAARRVLNALRESDMIEITVPFKESPDLVFRWSLEGAPEAIAQACSVPADAWGLRPMHQQALSSLAMSSGNQWSSLALDAPSPSTATRVGLCRGTST